MRPSQTKSGIRVGLRLLAIFFGFGACMCALTVVLLLFPGSELDRLWELNPTARTSFQTMGSWSVSLMVLVGAACAAAAIGLLRCATWGKWIAIVILVVNLVGDLANAVLRHDYRSLIGLPIAAAMILYLIRRGADYFGGPGTVAGD
jgi:sterol desaturase/sphingolipid hydroxylase (fatty acid hydroxylase superfamily)